jgi:hypothetical protein
MSRQRCVIHELGGTSAERVAHQARTSRFRPTYRKFRMPSPQTVGGHLICQSSPEHRIPESSQMAVHASFASSGPRNRRKQCDLSPRRAGLSHRKRRSAGRKHRLARRGVYKSDSGLKVQPSCSLAASARSSTTTVRRRTRWPFGGGRSPSGFGCPDNYPTAASCIRARVALNRSTPSGK